MEKKKLFFAYASFLRRRGSRPPFFPGVLALFHIGINAENARGVSLSDTYPLFHSPYYYY